MRLRGGGIYSYGFTTNLLLSLSLNKILKIAEYLANLEAKI